jgi:hypothetical protein
MCTDPGNIANRHMNVEIGTEAKQREYINGIFRCRFDVPPTDVSPTKNSWMLSPLIKASLVYCVPDRCVPGLDRIKHRTSSVGCYPSLGRPLAPNGSVGRLAGFAYAPEKVYWIIAPPSDACSPTPRTLPLRSAKACSSWKSGVASFNQNKGMGWFGQEQNSQGTLCPRDATSKNFRSGTHRSGTHRSGTHRLGMDKHCTDFCCSVEY